MSQVVAAEVDDPAVGQILLTLLLSGRKLDLGNANWGNLGHDFGELGLDFAKEIKALAGEARYARHVSVLKELNEVRNAIAHQDARKLSQCADKTPLTLSTFRSWRAQLNRVAIDMDRTAGTHLKQLTGSEPWA